MQDIHTDSVMFHPTLKYWLNEVVGGPLLLLAAAIALLLLDPQGGLVLALIAILLALSFIPRTVKTTRSYLEVDELGMRGQVHDSPPFDIPWAEVRAMRLTETMQRKTFLQVGDEKGWSDISLYELNAAAVWDALSDYAPHAVLEEDAFDRLPWMQAARAQEAVFLAPDHEVVRVRISKFYSIIGWLGLAFFVIIGVLAWRDDAPLVGGVLMFFGALEVYLIYYGNTVVHIGPETVGRVMPGWPAYGLRWDEVQRVEADHGDQQLVLYAAGKRLTLPGPEFWRGTDREAGGVAFFGHLEQRRIPFKRHARAYFALSKGTRVPRKMLR